MASRAASLTAGRGGLEGAEGPVAPPKRGVCPAERATYLSGVVALALAEQLDARRLAGLLSDRTLIGRQQRVGLPPPIGPVPEAVLALRSGLLTSLVLRPVGKDTTQLTCQQLRCQI